MIAKIAVSAANFAIDKPYSYRVPADMLIAPGQRVQLPFGRANRRTEGVVLAVEPGDDPKLKSVELLLDEQPILTDTQLRLAAFLRERYFCTFYDAIRAMLPAGLWFQTKAVYSLTEDRSWKEKTIRKEGAREILTLLEDLGGQGPESALREQFPEEAVLEEALAYLTKKKWIAAQQNFQRRLSDKTERVATLAVSPEEAMEYAASRPRSALMQKNVLELMCSLGTVAVKELCYFTGASMATVNRLESLGYLTLTSRPVLRCREITGRASGSEPGAAKLLCGTAKPNGRRRSRGGTAVRCYRIGKNIGLYQADRGLSGRWKERHAFGAGNRPDTPAAGAFGSLFSGQCGRASFQPVCR